MVEPVTHVPSFVHTLAKLLDPWKSLYSDSKPISIIVLFAHLGALLIGGGFAVAADRMTLRTFQRDRDTQVRHLFELQSVHRPILISIAILFVSGILMAAADVETFAVSPAFWIKIICVTLLLINGAILAKTEEALRFVYVGGSDRDSSQPSVDRGGKLWKRLRTTSVASLGLWTATVLAGTILAIAA